jgi:hypothetical protein
LEKSRLGKKAGLEKMQAWKKCMPAFPGEEAGMDGLSNLLII